MWRYLSSFLLVVALIVLAGFTWSGEPRMAATSVVKVTIPGGNGSGVHIGHGLVLTAAHVTKDVPEGMLKVVTEDGRTLDAQVLWEASTHDVALVYVEDWQAIPASDLACRVPTVGEAIKARGSPLGQDFITTWGKVAAPLRAIAIWREAVLVDITIGPGSSGGPVFDSASRVVGLAVGIFRAQPGFGVIVPGKTLCGLLAREA